MYFIHNKYDAASVNQLQDLPEGTVVIDLFGLRQSGDMTYGDMDKLAVSEIPCMMEELKFIEDEPQPEQREVSEMGQLRADIDYFKMMEGV